MYRSGGEVFLVGNHESRCAQKQRWSWKMAGSIWAESCDLSIYSDGLMYMYEVLGRRRINGGNVSTEILKVDIDDLVKMNSNDVSLSAIHPQTLKMPESTS